MDKLDIEPAKLTEEAETNVLYSEKARQYLVKIPIKVARLLGLQKGTKLRFKAMREGSEKQLEVKILNGD